MKNKYKPLLILLGIDVLFSVSFFIFHGHIIVSSEAELIIIPVIFVANILIAIILGLLKILRVLKFNIYKIFLLNAVIACIIFLLVDFSWGYYYEKMNYKTMTFRLANQDYQLVLTYRDTSYYIDKIWPGTAQPVMSGKYEMKNGRIEFNNNNFVVDQDSLSGFVNGKKLKLTTE